VAQPGRCYPPLTMRQVLIYPGEDGYWVAECPSLPGCVSQGETREQAVANACEAISGYLAALEENGLPMPELIENLFEEHGLVQSMAEGEGEELLDLEAARNAYRELAKAPTRSSRRSKLGSCRRS
jgi:predicted RNase H-like HicB family nuclease